MFYVKAACEGKVQVRLSETLLICLIVTKSIYLWLGYRNEVYISIPLVSTFNIKNDENNLLDIMQISGWHFNFHMLVLLYRINNEERMKYQKNGQSLIFKAAFLAELFILLYFSRSFSWISYNKENLLLTPNVINHQKTGVLDLLLQFAKLTMDRVHMNVVTKIDFYFFVCININTSKTMKTINIVT